MVASAKNEQQTVIDQCRSRLEEKNAASCRDTGFQGRIGVFEAVRVDETIRKIINTGGDEAVLAQHAFLHSPNLASAAREMVRTGETTPEEAIRISRSEDPANA